MAHTLSEINVLLLIARAAARETNANLMGNRHPRPASVFQLRLRKLKQVGFEIDNNFKNPSFGFIIMRIGEAFVIIWGGCNICSISTGEVRNRFVFIPLINYSGVFGSFSLDID